MSKTTRADERAVTIPKILFVTLLVAVFLVGAAVSALADMAFLSSPIGSAPVAFRPLTTMPPPATPEPKPRPTPARVSHPSTRSASGRCGGDLPPCWVMMRESRGDPNAHNPTGCNGRGCYGKWQFDPRTGDGTGSEAEQDAEARRVWDNGRGCSHWAACGR